MQSLLHCCLFPPRYFHSLELSAEDDDEEEEDLDWLILAVGELLFLLPEDSIASEFERRIDGLVIDFWNRENVFLVYVEEALALRPLFYDMILLST